MKITLDLSNSELSSTLSQFTQSSRELAQSQARCNEYENKFYQEQGNLRNKEYELQEVKRQLEGQKRETARVQALLDSAKAQLAKIAEATGTPVQVPGLLSLEDLTNVLDAEDRRNHTYRNPKAHKILSNWAEARRLNSHVDWRVDSLVRAGDELSRGNKIQSIKLVREALNIGLKEAKDFVESVEIPF